MKGICSFHPLYMHFEILVGRAPGGGRDTATEKWFAMIHVTEHRFLPLNVQFWPKKYPLTIGNVAHVYNMCDTYVIHVWCF